MILENVLKDVHSASSTENSDTVLLEALCLQTLVQIVFEDDVECGLRILDKIRGVLQESIFVPPEVISICMLLTGLYSDLSEEMGEGFPLESEKAYISALLCHFAYEGDPRGRGNRSHPIMLFYAWKLQLLALAGKKTHDSEVAEELFDACLWGLHKRQYKQQLLNAVSSH